jgi:hypothetical protein
MEIVLDESSNWHKILLATKVKPRQELDETYKKHSHPGYLNMIKSLKDLDDVNYIRKDIGVWDYNSKKIKERLEKCYKLGDCAETKNYYKFIKKKYIDKGITVKDVEATNKWFNEVARKALNDRAKELKK